MSIVPAGPRTFQVGRLQGAIDPPPLAVNPPVNVFIEGSAGPVGAEVFGEYSGTISMRNQRVSGQDVKTESMLELTQLTVGDRPVTFRNVTERMLESEGYSAPMPQVSAS